MYDVNPWPGKKKKKPKKPKLLSNKLSDLTKQLQMWTQM